MAFGGGDDNDEEALRVQELETELGSIRQAFEEYIATTQDLEIDLDKELQDMRKLSSSNHWESYVFELLCVCDLHFHSSGYLLSLI
jgi:hypothetical protein